MSLIVISIVLFAAAAIGGVVLALGHIKSNKPAIAVAVGHGMAATGGLVVLLVALSDTGMANLGGAAVAVFTAAALGGAFLFIRHLQNKELPRPVIGAHGIAAVIGFVLLLLFHFGV